MQCRRRSGVLGEQGRVLGPLVQALSWSLRLSTVMGADQILVLKDGRVVERGRHEDLVRRGGVYAGMWLQQQAGADTDAESKDRGTEKDPAPP
ncbi:PREDICTED: ATP-binding cassette sub-family B member 6, mitochondrial-like [Gavialis gangeticus]|uniref:ATP-binding cassette sub-family B member 6, mitochondrial-like n=1 Tax=Gavialis gangeticus TaxID=94835 RepID=UPI00092F3E76|nr:PREDICTED: ATP-binding cassette sub-family B member 6, mitochondrial-like [Gavialis gangeticus]